MRAAPRRSASRSVRRPSLSASSWAAVIGSIAAALDRVEEIGQASTQARVASAGHDRPSAAVVRRLWALTELRERRQPMAGHAVPALAFQSVDDPG